MALATTTNVREYGNLPAEVQLGDAVITPHLGSAARELKRWIGDYSASTGDKLSSCIEAECCICMAYMLSGLNTLYTEGLATIQKVVGEIDLMFRSPEQVDIEVERWLARAKTAVKEWLLDNDSRQTMGWYVL